MDKQKQIEELALELAENCLSGNMPKAYDIAEHLIEQDYRKVKKGKWISEMRERCDWRGKKQKYFQPNSCSKCHEPVIERTPYCPNCGAKMKGE